MTQVEATQDRKTKTNAFRLPGAADRTVVIGKTGSGKTTFAAWLLSKQRFDKRPWVILEFKYEELWERVGRSTIRKIGLNDMPGKRGLYRLPVDPGQEDALEDWLWKIRKRGNVGIFCDEVAHAQGNAYKAILRQGRALRIPVISCTQRPVNVHREIFSESSFISIFKMNDKRDYKIIAEFAGDFPIDRTLPPRWSYWIDKDNDKCLTLQPVPDPVEIARNLRTTVPTNLLFGT
jgi:hypothetical protein